MLVRYANGRSEAERIGRKSSGCVYRFCADIMSCYVHTDCIGTGLTKECVQFCRVAICSKIYAVIYVGMSRCIGVQTLLMLYQCLYDYMRNPLLKSRVFAVIL